MVISALCVRVKNVERSQMFNNWSTNKYNVVYPYNRLCFAGKNEWSTNTYYKMNELWKHYTKWKKATKTTYFMTPFMWNNQNKTIFKAGDIGRKWEVIANGYKVSLWGDENALKLIIVMTCTTLNILKTTEEFTLNEWIVCMWIIPQRMLPKKKTYKLRFCNKLFPSFIQPPQFFRNRWSNFIIADLK